MTPTVDEAGAVSLVTAAMQTSRGMRSVAEGKAQDAPLGSDARSFVGIARLLERLVEEVERQRTLARSRGDALARIAELNIRGGRRLVEASRWRDVATELREIAGETLATEPPPAARPPSPSRPGG